MAVAFHTPRRLRHHGMMHGSVAWVKWGGGGGQCECSLLRTPRLSLGCRHERVGLNPTCAFISITCPPLHANDAPHSTSSDGVPRQSLSFSARQRCNRSHRVRHRHPWSQWTRGTASASSRSDSCAGGGVSGWGGCHVSHKTRARRNTQTCPGARRPLRVGGRAYLSLGPQYRLRRLQ